MGNIYSSINESILSNINQIYKYDWLETSTVDECMDILKKFVKKDDIRFELRIGDDKGIYTHNHKEYGKISLSGIIDCINND